MQQKKLSKRTKDWIRFGSPNKPMTARDWVRIKHLTKEKLDRYK